MFIVLAILVLVPLAYFAGGFVMMLLMGVLHSWWHVIPTMGYFTSCLVALLLRLLFAGSANTTSNKK
jgi:hypothetical protein